MNQYPNKPVPVRFDARALDGDEMIVNAAAGLDGRWLVGHRDGRVVSVATMVEAVMTMIRWVADQPVAPDEVRTLPGGITPPASELARALRALGAAGPASAADLLDVSGLILSDRERAAVLAKIADPDLVRPDITAGMPGDVLATLADLLQLADIVGEVLAAGIQPDLDRLREAYAQYRPEVTP